MSIIPPKADSKPRELVPTGNHVATLFKIVNIGTIPTPYMNDDGTVKEQARIRLYFELPHEMREFETKDGEKKTLPMSISREVTLSLYKSEKMTSVLRTTAHALIGQSLTDQEAEVFNVEDLLNMHCMVEVAHETMSDGKGTKFAKAVGFGSIPKGMEVPEQINKGVIQNVREMSQDEIEALPDWLRDKMKSSREYHVRFLAPRTEAPQATDTIGDTNVPYPTSETSDGSGKSIDDIEYPEDEINPEDIPF
jgi:hypothetical protein